MKFKIFSYNEEFDFSCYIHLLCPQFEDNITFVKSVTFSNEKFVKHLFLLTTIQYNVPVFQEIIAIFVHNESAYFIFDRWNTIMLDPDLMSYEIEKKEEVFSVIPYDKLYHPTPFDKLIVSQKHFIVPKHTII